MENFYLKHLYLALIAISSASASRASDGGAQPDPIFYTCHTAPRAAQTEFPSRDRAAKFSFHAPLQLMRWVRCEKQPICPFQASKPFSVDALPDIKADQIDQAFEEHERNS